MARGGFEWHAFVGDKDDTGHFSTSAGAPFAPADCTAYMRQVACRSDSPLQSSALFYGFSRKSYPPFTGMVCGLWPARVRRALPLSTRSLLQIALFPFTDQTDQPDQPAHRLLPLCLIWPEPVASSPLPRAVPRFAIGRACAVAVPLVPLIPLPSDALRYRRP